MALGLLLVTAAALKLSGLNVTAIPRAGWFATPQVQIIAAEWELILGFWLLSGAWRFAAWILALLTFTSFAVISAYFGYIGIASCGCFGVIRTSPWTVFTIDIAAIALLFFAFPLARRASEGLRGFTLARPSGSHAMIPLTALAILIALTAIGSFTYGSPAAALAKLRGESLTVEPSYVDFGDGKPGDVLEATVRVYNWTDQPVRLIGGTSDGSCVVTRDLPTIIYSSQYCLVRIQIRIPMGQDGWMTRNARLITDLRLHSTVRLRLGYRIRP